MALEITDRHAVVQGIPLVQGSDKSFRFGRPQLVLQLIHFALFQDCDAMPLQLHHPSIICSCNSDGFKDEKSIFDEQTSKALKKWHMAVRTMYGSIIGLTMHSPGPTLHGFKTTGHSTRSSTYEDQDEYESDSELSPTSPATNLIVRVDDSEQQAEEDKQHSAGELHNCEA